MSMSRAKALQVEVVELDELYPRCDFITVHVPMTDETRGMIKSEHDRQDEDGVRLINCARGGIINEKDLSDAIKNGKGPGRTRCVRSRAPKDSPLRELKPSL